MQPDVNSQLWQEYKFRINRVIDYIENNLTENFTLENLAGIANFSKFHFHRIFYSLIGETLFQFIQRMRMERAASMLLANKNKSITEVALDCGFSGSASFAKSFKEYYKMSASEWRKQINNDKSNSGIENSNLSKMVSNGGKDYFQSSMYITHINNLQTWRIQMNNKTQTIEIKDLPEMTVAYVRHIGPYAGDAKLFEGLYQKLFKWAGPRNLINFPETKNIIIYHDNPEITKEENLRVSVCITVPPDTEVSGEIGKLVLAAGKYALAHFEITDKEFGDAWNWVYGEWMPKSGYEPDDRQCFEMYLNDPKDHPAHKFIVDICAPIRPLR
jgi:AraC family transcriptional regulator